MNTTRIAFIGGGNMSRALIEGLVDDAQLSISVSDPGSDAREALTAIDNIDIFKDNREAVHNADCVVFAVKPQIMRGVCQALKTDFENSKPLLVSVAAGITTEHIASWCGDQSRIVRVMPNTPALIGCGATGMFAANGVTEADKALVTSLFESVGLAVWVEPETDIDAVTALSGSGPAYFFVFLEHLEKTAISLGLEPHAARRLARQTALGSALMALKEDGELGTLRERVTSPGGTTAAALTSFEEHSLDDIVHTALIAARDRARELAAEFGEDT